MRLLRTFAKVWWRWPWPVKVVSVTVVTLAIWEWRWWLIGICAIFAVAIIVRVLLGHRHLVPRVPRISALWVRNRLAVRWRYLQAAKACDLVGPRDVDRSRRRPPAVRIARSATGWTCSFTPPRGMAPDDVRAAAESIASAFGVPATVSGTLDVEIALRTHDPLIAPVHQGCVPSAAADLSGSLPVAVSESGDVVSLQQAHVLVVGATGSGKGSALWAVVRAVRPAASANLVRYVGLDSKASEVRQAEKLFCETAYSVEDHARVLADLAALIARRGEMHTGREFLPTREEPLVMVLIDEITSLTSIFKDAKERNAALADLRVVLSLGRSRGVLVVGAGQDPTKEAMPLRSLFPQMVALRLRDATETRVALGEGAQEAGARPHEIEVASRSNAYATAGIGYVRDETGQLQRVRFPYASDADLAALVDAFQDHTGHGCGRDVQEEHKEEVA